MEDKFLKTEEGTVELEEKDLENVAGGRKWGDEDNRVKGPRADGPALKGISFITADAGEDDKEKDEVLASFAEKYDHRRGGII